MINIYKHKLYRAFETDIDKNLQVVIVNYEDIT